MSYVVDIWVSIVISSERTNSPWGIDKIPEARGSFGSVDDTVTLRFVKNPLEITKGKGWEGSETVIVHLGVDWDIRERKR